MLAESEHVSVPTWTRRYGEQEGDQSDATRVLTPPGLGELHGAGSLCVPERGWPLISSLFSIRD